MLQYKDLWERGCLWGVHLLTGCNGEQGEKKKIWFTSSLTNKIQPDSDVKISKIRWKKLKRLNSSLPFFFLFFSLAIVIKPLPLFAFAYLQNRCMTYWPVRKCSCLFPITHELAPSKKEKKERKEAGGDWLSSEGRVWTWLRLPQSELWVFERKVLWHTLLYGVMCECTCVCVKTQDCHCPSVCTPTTSYEPGHAGGQRAPFRRSVCRPAEQQRLCLPWLCWGQRGTWIGSLVPVHAECTESCADDDLHAQIQRHLFIFLSTFKNFWAFQASLVFLMKIRYSSFLLVVRL